MPKPSFGANVSAGSRPSQATGRGACASGLSSRRSGSPCRRRVLSSQWQGEFCRCSIDVVGGKQCDGGVDHLKRFRHNAGPSPKAGKPVAQPAVDPLNRHCFILPDIMPPNRQERVVRRIIICTVQLDAPGFQPLQQPVQRGGITTATFPVDEALARAIKSQPDPQLVLFF